MDAPAAPNPDATLLMNAAADGDKYAADRLLPLVYDQLRKAAQLQMAGERPDHTLTATALVHEAYLKLVGPREVTWQGRAHFYAAAAEAMRRILLDHAKASGRRKRGAGLPRHPISVVDLAAAQEPEEIVALDQAICRLESQHPDAAAVVRLRFYAGLTGDDTAAALAMSPRQVDRLWSFARVWLFRELENELGSDANGEGANREPAARPGNRE